MEQQVTIVGALMIGLSVFGILIALFIFILLAGIGSLVEDQEASVVLVAIGSFLAFFLIILSIPGIIGGIGLFKRREWARILVIILSAMQLINIPIGTAIGIYSIWVMVQKETILLFNPIVPPTPGQSG